MENYWRAKVDMFDINFSVNNPLKTYEYVDEDQSASNLKSISKAEFDAKVEEMLTTQFREMELQRLKKENLELKNEIERLRKKYRKKSNK